MSYQFLLDSNLIDRIFPFALQVDRDLTILHTGKSLSKLIPNSLSSHFKDIFDIIRPKHAALDFQSMLDFGGQIFIIETKRNIKKLRFRYEMLFLEENNTILFLGSPWITQANELKKYGLRLKDFALHDPITDLLQVMTVREIAIQEVQELNQKLEKSELRYRQIVESAHDMIYYTDINGYFTYVNPVVLEKLKRPKSEVLGTHFYDFILPEKREEVYNFYLKKREEKIDKTYLEFPIKSGEEVIWIGQNAAANYNQNGEIVSFTAVARDITERKLIEENLRSTELRLRNLISNLQSGILVENENRNIVLTNQFFCELFEIKIAPDQMIGFDCTNAAEESKHFFTNPEIFVKEIEKTLFDKKVVVGHELFMNDGRVLERDYIPIYSKGNYQGHLWQYRDLTEEKQAQQNLIKARHEAEAAQEAEKQFLAKMSHEIRTPLNAVVGMSHLLNETKTTMEQKEYLDVLMASSDLLKNLISDILDLSKITAGQVEKVIKPFNLKKLILSLEKSFQHKLKEKAVRLIVSFDDRIKNDIVGDELLLNQILINLLSNASKFTDKGEIILAIKLVNAEKAYYQIQFSVSDTGIGISKEQLERIFKSFKQADENISRQYGGTGLGLAIVSQLVELLNGDIKVESQPGKGSIFTVLVPFEDSGDKQMQTSNSSAMVHNIDQLKLLVAEDNVMNRKYVSRLLEKWGVHYDIVNDGEDAIKYVEKNEYDVILMDIQMPQIGGYEATRKIRKLKNNPNQNIPIIALTASALTEHKQEAADAGMNDFISKPFKPNQLKNKLYEYASSKEDENKIEKPIRSFHEALDVNYLDQFYENDMDYATEMFDLFVIHVFPDYLQLKIEINKNEINRARKLIHKIGPSFAMVGLTKIEQELKELKDLLVDKMDKPKVDKKIYNIQKQVNILFPIIESERERLLKMKAL